VHSPDIIGTSDIQIPTRKSGRTTAFSPPSQPARLQPEEIKQQSEGIMANLGIDYII
jgi:hypothetical protein